jgi:hypothetical protein
MPRRENQKIRHEMKILKANEQIKSKQGPQFRRILLQLGFHRIYFVAYRGTRLRPANVHGLVFTRTATTL